MEDAYDDSIEDVRVIPAGESTPLAYIAQDRTPAQKAQDDILNKAQAAAELAFEKCEEAIGWLEVLGPVKARTAPIFINQLIAEIAETRRVRQ